MSKNKKWILKDDGELILGMVGLHKELNNNKLTGVKGGGWFFIKDNTVFLYSSSYDFGKCKIEDFKGVYLMLNRELDYRFSTMESIENVEEFSEPIEFKDR